MDTKKIPAYVVKTSGSTKLQSELLNIDGSDDLFYRYKMRQLFVQVVGKGKMIKTVLLNVDDVAKDLKVSPAYMTAYLGYEMGAQSKYDPKKPDRERASISGDRDAKELSEMVRKFISEMVLCPRCNYPELSMYIEKKTGEIGTNCRGCGTISVLNLRAKMSQYILNHPSKSIASKEEIAVKKKQEEVTGEQAPETQAVKTDSKVKKERLRKKKEDDDDDDIEWSRSTDEDAVRSRRKEMLPDSVKNLIVLGDAQKGDPCSELQQFIQSNPDGDIVSEVKRLQGVYGFPNNKRAHLLFDVIFEPNKVPNIKKHQQVLSGLIVDESSQLGVLECIEKLCSTLPLLKKALQIVKEFYDQDILDEPTLLKWYEYRITNQDIQKELTPFIDWLKNADEESEDEEEVEDQE